MALGGLTFQ